MLYRNLLQQALIERRESFARFDRRWREEVREYARRLRALNGRSTSEVLRALGPNSTPGAVPSTELDRAGQMAVPFAPRWRSHEEARRWALDALLDRTTFAADGSQLLPGREISLPVAAIQVATFENPHTRDGKYSKDAQLKVIMPQELLEEYAEQGSAETVVSLARFRLEVEALCAFIERQRGWQQRPGTRPPVGFFDGTLLVSISQPRTKIQAAYVSAVVELVRLSRDAAVPIVGYVDQSYARDLIWMLNALEPGDAPDTRARTLYDAQLLHAAIADDVAPVLDHWGARTVFCSCKRQGLSEAFDDERGAPLVGFTYLQTTGSNQPARLDVPVWVYEAGLLDEVVDAVRAECVSGLGYPYAIETADAAAVITARDRVEFLRAVQEFATRGGLSFDVSRKAASKVRRR